MIGRFAVALAVVVATWGGNANAQEQRLAAAVNSPASVAPMDVPAEAELVGPRLARPIAEAPENDRLRRAWASQPRPRVLTGLYASLAGLNALDVYTTMRALDSGAREVNPVMAPAAGNPGASLAIKAATTVGSVYLAEKLWKKNRVAAIVTMVAVNAGTAAVVARNLRNAR